jgi:C4-dicarboxylate-specific signal transduction histidine kinase
MAAFLRNLSLRYVLLGALLLGLLVPAWLALEYEAADVRARLSEALKGDANRYADMLGVALREPMWQLAPAFGKPLVDTIMDDTRVTRIVVKQLPGGEVFLENTRAAGGASVISVSRPIAVAGRTLGELTVDISTQSVAQGIAQAQARFFWRTSATALGTLLLIFFILHKRLTQPIARLVRQSEALAAGQLDRPIVWNRNDELGRVGISLDNTRRALAALIGELQTVNENLKVENEERRRAEDALAQHAGALEARVSERTRELSAANAALSITLSDLRQTQYDLIESEKLAGLGRMVAGVAHELNTPIGNALTIGSAIGERVNALRSALSSGGLKRSTMDAFLNDTAQASQVLERSLQLAASHVSRFKQAAAHRGNEERSEFALDDLLRRVVGTLQPGFEELGVQLSLQVPAGIHLNSYPEMLGQVVSNLATNAQVHAFEGRAGGHILVQAREAQDTVEIVVQDDGVGIAADIQGRIFDPLFTTRMGRGGLGLGLSVVYNIVTRHLGGKIQVVNAAGGGARFVVTLLRVAPLQPAPDNMADAAAD